MSAIIIIIFIFILGLLIFIHEGAHFLIAKHSGILVEEFCIGFPPRIFSRKKGETLYSIGLLPLGGFVKIYGEDDKENTKEGSFWSKSISTRAKVIVGGVLANLLLAICLFSIGHMIGLPTAIVDEVPPNAKDVAVQIADVAPGSPAEEANIKGGDKILSIKNPSTGKTIQVNDIEDIQNFTKDNLGKNLIITIKRGDEIIETKIVPRENPPENQGPMGIALVKTARVPYPFFQAIWEGIKTTFWVIYQTFAVFFEIIKSKILGVTGPPVQFAGPVGITVLVDQMFNLGVVYLIQFIALLSVNLAIINILPFPALDGGRLVFLGLEKIKGKPVKTEIENLVNNIGFILLMILMIAVTFQDIKKFF
ncbi:MAG: RIP metalloprotease RseP [Candidatus Pacebacteria bacterium]|nr:RIP metalloprotease RseP [Candidatus Paceibacterota bacterium]